MDCSKIDEGLFLGSATASKKLDELQRLGITHIVNLAGRSWHPGSFEYLVSHVEDAPDSDLLGRLPGIFAFVDAAAAGGGRVFLHCSGGVSRSPAVAIGIVMHRRRVGLLEAFRVVKSRRGGIKPNLGFLKQLLVLEERVLPAGSAPSILEANLPSIAKICATGSTSSATPGRPVLASGVARSAKLDASLETAMNAGAGCAKSGSVAMDAGPGCAKAGSAAMMAVGPGCAARSPPSDAAGGKSSAPEFPRSCANPCEESRTGSATGAACGEHTAACAGAGWS